MSVVDTLITKFELDNKDYLRGADGVKRANADLKGSMSTIMSIGGAGGIAGAAATAAVVTIGAIGATLFTVGQRASVAASEFEVLERSMAAVVGNSERAKEVFDFVQKQAGPSAFFGVKELGNAAKLLETFRLETEQFLPVANTMASLFGQNEETLTSFVMALGRIKAGSYGEGFERLREMGITRAMLEGEGLTFNSSNQYVGEADRALAAIRSAVNKNFGNLDAEMAGTASAMQASFFDSLDRGFAEIGKPLNESLKEVYADLSEDIQRIVDTGLLQDFGQGLADVVDTFRETMPSLTELSIWANAIVKTLPAIGEILSGPAKNIGGWIYNALGGGRTYFDEIRDQEATIAEMEQDPRSVASRERWAERERLRRAARNALSQGAESDKLPAEIVRQTAMLESIDRTLKKSYDLSRQAFGFGAGQSGFTAVDLSEKRRSRGGDRVEAAIVGIASIIREAMVEEIMRDATGRRFAT